MAPMGRVLRRMVSEEQDLTTKIALRRRVVRNAQKLSLQQLLDRTGDVLSRSRISN